MTNIAVFASGTGTNAKAIIEHFKDNKFIRVALIVTNKPDAGVIKIAEAAGVDWIYVPNAEFEDEEMILSLFDSYDIAWIVLAGWLRLVPAYLVITFKNKIVNIHPALLPKHGGRGMYGHHVHEAVASAKDKESGITIHLVNENFDEGRILFQAKFQIKDEDGAEEIERQVRKLELNNYPEQIEKLILTWIARRWIYLNTLGALSTN